MLLLGKILLGIHVGAALIFGLLFIVLDVSSIEMD